MFSVEVSTVIALPQLAGKSVGAIGTHLPGLPSDKTAPL